MGPEGADLAALERRRLEVTRPRGRIARRMTGADVFAGRSGSQVIADPAVLLGFWRLDGLCRPWWQSAAGVVPAP
jgi:hypothetical protein